MTWYALPVFQAAVRAIQECHTEAVHRLQPRPPQVLETRAVCIWLLQGLQGSRRSSTKSTNEVGWYGGLLAAIKVWLQLCIDLGAILCCTCGVVECLAM